ncbi:MAG: hypothetical protein AAF533_18610 [Acidobacteriota bacterium]
MSRPSVAVVALSLLVVSPVRSQEFLGALGDGIARIQADGTRVSYLTRAMSSFAVGVDETAGKLYWANSLGGNRIERSNLDGSGSETLFDIDGLSAYLEVDPAGKLYWIDNGVLRRSNLDGSAREDLRMGVGLGLSLDLVRGKVYWTEGGDVRRGNLDGTADEDVVLGQGAFALAVDPTGPGKIYWAQAPGVLARANLDGSMIEMLGPGPPTPSQIALDPAEGKLYFANGLANDVRRVNLDGSSPEVLLDGLGVGVNGLAVAPGVGKVYVPSFSNPGQIRVVNLDGTMPGVVVLGTGLAALAVDPLNGLVYVADNSGRRVSRVNLDGSNAEVLIEEPDFVRDVEVDPVGGKVYWIETAQLKRANLDGSSVEVLVDPTDASPFDALELDLTAGKLYWLDDSAGFLRRADLDGSNVEDVVPVGFGQAGLALDPVGGHVYWGETDKIRRAGLDGTNAMDLIAISGTAFSLMLDLPAGRISWFEFPAMRVQAANLDGSGAEELFSTISYGQPVFALESLPPVVVPLPPWATGVVALLLVLSGWVVLGRRGAA